MHPLAHHPFRRISLALWAVSSLIPLATAQVYAPHTEYHDPAQRLFVPEVARVMAWQQGWGEAVVTASVSAPTADGQGRVTWKVEASGRPALRPRSATVAYEMSRLLDPQVHFRAVFAEVAQMMGPAPLGKKGGPAVLPAEVAKAFWTGAAQAGPARVDTAVTAQELTQGRALTVVQAARLAGLLSHGALGKWATQTTLDVQWITRSAVWLCLIEAHLGQKVPDELWAPVVFLCGRSGAAKTLWQHAPKDFIASSALARGWDLWLTGGQPREAFLCVAREDFGVLALPLMMAQIGADRVWATRIAENMSELLPSSVVGRTFDAAPRLMRSGGVGIGNQMSQEAPQSLRAWMEATHRLGADFLGTRLTAEEKKAVEAALTGTKQNGAEADEAAGFKRLAPLMALGAEGGARQPLRPVAATSAWDWLAYGYESAAVQFGALYIYLDHSLGVDEQADQLRQVFARNWPGAPSVFGHERPGTDEKPDVTPDRFAFVSLPEIVRQIHLDNDSAPRPGTPAVPLRDRWLYPHCGAEMFEISLRHKTGDETLDPLLERWLKEGGRQSAYGLLYRKYSALFSAWTRENGRSAKIVTATPGQVLVGKPWFELGKGKGLWQQAGQEIETMAWVNEAPSAAATWAIKCYLYAGASEDARRFYREFRTFYTDSVSLSGTEYPLLYPAAWLARDESFMKLIAEDASTYSWTDLYMQICAAVGAKELTKAESLAQAMLARYPGVSANAIVEVISHLPALVDRQHADHAAALAFFAGPRRLNLWIDWMCAEAAGLSPEERLPFFGQEKATTGRKAVLAALTQNRGAYDTLIKDSVSTLQEEEVALVIHLGQQAFGLPVPRAGASQKPTDFRSLAEVIAEKTTQRHTATTATKLALTGQETADTLFTRLSELNDKKKLMQAITTLGRQPTSEQLQSFLRDRLQQMSELSRTFRERFPQDPRRWQAALAPLRSQMTWGAGNLHVPALDTAVADALLAATDATPAEKATAAFSKLLPQMIGNPVEPPAAAAARQAQLAFIKEHPTTAEAKLIRQSLSQQARRLPAPEIKPFLADLAKSGDSELGKIMDALREQQAARTKLKTEPLEATFTLPDGTPLTAASLRGKVVLLDFWASWCGPCMAEMPSLAKLHADHASEGLQIIGICLDEEKSALEGALKSAKIVWPQHFDGQGFGGPLPQRFGIDAIPSVWLFDRQGQLHRSDLRGPALEAAVQELLKTPAEKASK
jgi:thiol-disulfide isomerase/thioredoxin